MSVQEEFMSVDELTDFCVDVTLEIEKLAQKPKPDPPPSKPSAGVPVSKNPEEKPKQPKVMADQKKVIKRKYSLPKLTKLDKLRDSQHNGILRYIDLYAEIILVVMFIAEGFVAAGLISGGDGEAPGWTRFILHETIAAVMVLFSLAFIPLITRMLDMWLNKDYKVISIGKKLGITVLGSIVAIICFVGAMAGPIITFLLIANGTGQADVVRYAYHNGMFFDVFYMVASIHYTLAGTYMMMMIHYLLELVLMLVTPLLRVNREVLELMVQKEDKEIANELRKQAEEAEKNKTEQETKKSKEQFEKFIATHGFAPSINDPKSALPELKVWLKEAGKAISKFKQGNKTASIEKRSKRNIKKHVEYAEFIESLTKIYFPKIQEIGEKVYDATVLSDEDNYDIKFAEDHGKTGFSKLLLAIQGNPAEKSSDKNRNLNNASLILTKFNTLFQTVKDNINYLEGKGGSFTDVLRKIIDQLFINNTDIKNLLKINKAHLTSVEYTIPYEDTEKPMLERLLKNRKDSVK